MMDILLSKAIILFVVTFLVTFVGAGTGGSAMFTVPLCIFLGFPVPEAVATTRLGALFSMLGAFAGFSKHKKIDYKLGTIGAIISCIGAYAGASLLLFIPNDCAKKLMGVFIILLLAVSMIKKRIQRIVNLSDNLIKFFGYVMFFLAGSIGGAFGGQGVIIVYTLTLFFGMDFVRAAGTRCIISIVITLTSLGVYYNSVTIHWEYGIILSIASLFGAYLGSLYSVKKGEGLIEKIFEIVVILVSLKLLMG